MNSFERTIGPGADVKELEYVSALHQTSMPHTRPDGTISSLDIVRYLKSRHSLEISHPQARDIVLGLGGGSLCEAVIEELIVAEQTQQLQDANKPMMTKSFWKRKSRDEEIRQEAQEEEMDVQAERLNPTFAYLDLVQTASILLIPTLAGIAQTRKQRSNERMVSGAGESSVDPALEEQPHGAGDSNGGPPETFDQGGQQEEDHVVDDSSLKNLMQDVLHILFKNSEPFDGQSGKGGAPLVTPELVEGLLLENQEEERAKDSALIQRMVAAAHSSSGRLDEEAFLNALTSDLNGYEEGCEVMPSLITMKRTTKEASPGDEEEPKTNPVEVTKIDPLLVIDSVVDEYASVAMLLLTWLFFLASSTTFLSVLNSTSAFEAGCKENGEESFGCTLLSTIYTWLTIALVLTGCGLTVIIPVSYGNHPTKRGPGRLLFACLITTIYSVVPYVSLTQYKNNSSEPFDGPEEIVNSNYFDAWKTLTLSLGLVCASMYLLQFCVAVVRKFDWLDEHSRFAKFFVTSNVRGAARLKKAATHKIGLVLENARRMHGPISAPSSTGEMAELSKSTRNSNTDPIFRNFVLYGETKVSAGSFRWTWQRIISGNLFEVEGIWLPARLLIFQGSQLLFGSVLSFVLIMGVEPIAKQADDAQASLGDDLPQWIYDIVPTAKQVRYALYPASGVAIFMMWAIALVYMPSTTKTILKYRCGQTHSLGSATFSSYRASVDATHMNTANGIYAMGAGAILFWLLIALVIFLFIWPFSQGFMLLLLAWGIGLTITIVLKMVVTGYFRKKAYRAYYRVSPKLGNISALALECWFIGLGGGILIGRVTQFLLAAAFWIGRIDVPFLSSDVQLFGYAFDYIPVNFVKELLVHEAHRHPYIERLGEMYLMRLRQGKSFGSEAGSCWRQLFVVALMPWLIKHRVYHEQRAANSIADLLGEAKLKLDEDRNRLKEVGQGAVDAGAGAVDRVGELPHTVLDAGTGVVHAGKDSLDTFGGRTKDAYTTTISATSKMSGRE